MLELVMLLQQVMTGSNHSSRPLSYMSYSEEGGKALLMFASHQLYPPERRVQFLRGQMSQITTFMVQGYVLQMVIPWLMDWDWPSGSQSK